MTELVVSGRDYGVETWGRPALAYVPSAMTAAATAAREAMREGVPGVKSKDASSLAQDLLDAPAAIRLNFLRNESSAIERTWVFRETARITGSMYGQWYDSPSAFVEDVLGETIWSAQRQILDSLANPGVKRVIIPAGFGVGKTYLAGRAVAWAGAVNPVGTITIVTTATRMRQVASQLWPHIKKAVARGGLPGYTDTIQWMQEDMYGNKVQVAYGFSSSPYDESAIQGIHAQKLLLVVDEAGGISPIIGKGTNNLLTGNAKLLAIGNPAMNEPGSWFENMCKESEDPSEPTTTGIRISTLDSPAITGEPTPICRDCNPNIDGHTIAGGVPSHLPDRDWLMRTLREYGTVIPYDASLQEIEAAAIAGGHPYIIAKVLARFPQDASNKVMPASWVEAAVGMHDPTGEDWIRPCDLGLENENDTFTIKRGSWIRLGVDVAADGGDEFAIYRSIGDVIHQRHTSSGAQNADPARVAELILDEIDSAERLAVAIGSTAKVRVKIDRNGLGWGVVGFLERWGKTGRHNAEISGVMVSESPGFDDPAAVMRPYRKRDEMWLTGRFLLQPDPSTGFGRLRLRVDHECKIQLSNPNIGNNAAGFVVIESKASMRARQVHSPDRAEAALLAIYEGQPIGGGKRRGLLIP